MLRSVSAVLVQCFRSVDYDVYESPGNSARNSGMGRNFI